MNSLHVKENREKLGLTQEKLGELIGVSKNTVYNYENGGVIPKAKIPILEFVFKKNKINSLTTKDHIINNGDNNVNVQASKNIKVNEPCKDFADMLKTAQDQQTKLMEQLSESQKHLSESQKQVSKLIEIISNKLK